MHLQFVILNSAIAQSMCNFACFEMFAISTLSIFMRLWHQKRLRTTNIDNTKFNAFNIILERLVLSYQSVNIYWMICLYNGNQGSMIYVWILFHKSCFTVVCYLYMLWVQRPTKHNRVQALADMVYRLWQSNKLVYLRLLHLTCCVQFCIHKRGNKLFQSP